MPGRGTTRRTIRIPDDLWGAAVAKARRDGVAVAEVIRRALERFIGEEPPEES